MGRQVSVLMLRLTRESLEPDGCSEHEKHHRATAGGIQLPGVMGLSSTVEKKDCMSFTTRQACRSADGLLCGMLGAQVKQPRVRIPAGPFCVSVRDTVMLQGADPLLQSRQ